MVEEVFGVATGTRWSHPWYAQNLPIGRRAAGRQREPGRAPVL